MVARLELEVLDVADARLDHPGEEVAHGGGEVAQALHVVEDETVKGHADVALGEAREQLVGHQDHVAVDVRHGAHALDLEEGQAVHGAQKRAPAAHKLPGRDDDGGRHEVDDGRDGAEVGVARHKNSQPAGIRDAIARDQPQNNVVFPRPRRVAQDADARAHAVLPEVLGLVLDVAAPVDLGQLVPVEAEVDGHRHALARARVRQAEVPETRLYAVHGEVRLVAVDGRDVDVDRVRPSQALPGVREAAGDADEGQPAAPAGFGADLDLDFALVVVAAGYLHRIGVRQRTAAGRHC
ncbi:ORF056 [Saltwater crocodilepox virus]|nr:ORF056 [Saltwater crocodilepox virus]